MCNGRWLEKNKLKDNKGFTLVEVITSFAVLAIISVALLQMFVLSTRTNRTAYDMDKANALCVDMGEIYKADPGDVEITSNCAISPSLLANPVTFTRYYDKEWSGYTTLQTIQSAYRLDIVQQTTATTSISISYHPEFGFSEKLNSCDSTGNGLNYTLTLENVDATTAQVRLGGGAMAEIISPVTIKLEDGIYKAFIQLDFNPVITSQLNQCLVQVNNTAQIGTTPVAADIYIGNSSKLSDGKMAVALDEDSIGLRNCSYIDSGSRMETDYLMAISVTRLSDGLKMAENTVRKHLVK